MEALAAIIMLISLLAVIPGLVCVVSPKTVRMGSRWLALPMITAPLAGLSVGVLINPINPETKQADTEFMAVAAMLGGIWLIILLASRAAGRSPAAEPPVSLPDHVDRVVPDRSAAEMAQIEKAARLKRRDSFASVTAVTPAAPAPRSRAAKPLREYDPGSPDVDTGSYARISYIDSDGVVTDRELFNWRIDGNKLIGFCQTRKAVRTFRVDRVDDWIDWKP